MVFGFYINSMALCGIGGFDIINKELILIDEKNIKKVLQQTWQKKRLSRFE